MAMNCNDHNLNEVVVQISTALWSATECKHQKYIVYYVPQTFTLFLSNNVAVGERKSPFKL